MMKMKDKRITLKDLDKMFKRYKAKGMKPFIKGKGSGKIKIRFEK